MSGPDLIEYYEDKRSNAPHCEHCGWELNREVCDVCDGMGLYGHDCGEDCCCCLEPEDNMPCDRCGGDGGWWWCENTDCRDGERGNERCRQSGYRIRKSKESE